MTQLADVKSGWTIAGIGIACFVAAPILLLLAQLLSPTAEVWTYLWNALLPEMLRNTLLLVLGVALGTLVIGTSLAALVTFYDFPGRRWFEWLLMLPLAVPAYVLGFVFMATFDYAGPFQTAFRTTFGTEAQLVNIRSGWVAVVVMCLTLYPYVYFLARAAFREQSANTFDVARTMGLSRAQTIRKLVIPMARPSVIAGVTLAVLEAMTDFATVRFFNFPTLSEGVVRVWQGMMNRGAAIELAALLCIAALLVIVVERLARGRARYYQTGLRSRDIKPARLNGRQKWLATGACTAVFLLAFGLPALRLSAWVVSEIAHESSTLAQQTVYGAYVLRTFGLATVAAGLAIGCAFILGYGARRSGRFGRSIARVATMGYALPGAVIAAGVLVTLSSVDRTVLTPILNWISGHSGLVVTGTVVGLFYAYVVRFMAVAYGSVESSLEKVTPNMEAAARTLGATSGKVLWRVYMPLTRAGIIAGAVLVFVDVMKELPATMLLAPFGMETLSIWTYMLAAESLWESAALPALTIVAVSAVPIALLVRINSATRLSASQNESTP